MMKAEGMEKSLRVLSNRDCIRFLLNKGPSVKNNSSELSFDGQFRHPQRGIDFALGGMLTQKSDTQDETRQFVTTHADFYESSVSNAAQ